MYFPYAYPILILVLVRSTIISSCKVFDYSEDDPSSVQVAQLHVLKCLSKELQNLHLLIASQIPTKREIAITTPTTIDRDHQTKLRLEEIAKDRHLQMKHQRHRRCTNPHTMCVTSPPQRPQKYV